MSHARIFHFNINVRDLDTSVAFYEMLGFRVTHRERLGPEVNAPTMAKLGGEGTNGAEYALVKLGTAPTATCIDLVQWDHPVAAPPPQLNQIGVPRLAIQVDDPGALLARLAASGIRLTGPPGGDDPAGHDPGQMFAFRDPDGMIVEVVSGLDHLVGAGEGEGGVGGERTAGSDERLGDRLAIHELRARYNHHYDAKELDAFVSIFTDDGLLQLGPAGWAKGHDELRSALAGPMQAAEFAAHFTTDETTEFTGQDTARGRSRFAVHTGSQPAIEGAGTYHDTYRRVNGEWKLSSRIIDFFYFGPRAVSFPGRPTVPPPPPGALPPEAASP